MHVLAELLLIKYGISLTRLVELNTLPYKLINLPNQYMNISKHTNDKSRATSKIKKFNASPTEPKS